MKHIGVRIHGKTWEYYFEGQRTDGKRTRIFKSGFESKEQALEAGLQTYEEYQRNGLIFKPSDILFMQFLRTWLSDKAKRGCSKNTLNTYTRLIQRNVYPVFRKYKLKSVNSIVLQKFFNQKMDSGYAKSNIQLLAYLLEKAFDCAVKQGLIMVNPMKNVEIDCPKTINEILQIKKERKVIPLEIIDKIFERFPETTPTHIPMMLAYSLGIRPSECFALIWEDIDFDNNTLNIKRQVKWDEKSHEWTLYLPKDDSPRILPMDEEIVELLKREKGRQDFAKKYYGSFYIRNYVNDQDQINSKGDGREINLLTVRFDGTYIHPRTMHHTASVVHKELNCIDFDLTSLCYTHDKIKEQENKI